MIPGKSLFVCQRLCRPWDTWWLCVEKRRCTQNRLRHYLQWRDNGFCYYDYYLMRSSESFMIRADESNQERIRWSDPIYLTRKIAVWIFASRLLDHHECMILYFGKTDRPWCRQQGSWETARLQYAESWYETHHHAAGYGLSIRAYHGSDVHEFSL